MGMEKLRRTGYPAGACHRARRGETRWRGMTAVICRACRVREKQLSDTLRSSDCTRRPRDGCAAPHHRFEQVVHALLGHGALDNHHQFRLVGRPPAPAPAAHPRPLTARALTVTRSRIGCPATFSPLFCIASNVSPRCRRCRIWPRRRNAATSSADGPGFRQRVFQVRHRLAGRTIEHLADRNRRDQTVIIAAAERRVEEEVAGFLKTASAPNHWCGVSCRSGRSSNRWSWRPASAAPDR